MHPRVPQILLADNEPAGHANLRRQLLATGYDVAFASSASEAIWHLYPALPDVLIVEVDLPDMDGFELCEHVRHSMDAWDTTVIFLSAAPDDMTRAYIGQMVDYVGGDYFFIKPYDARLVVKVIDETLSERPDDLERPRMIFPTRVIWPTSCCRASTV